MLSIGGVRTASIMDLLLWSCSRSLWWDMWSYRVWRIRTATSITASGFGNSKPRPTSSNRKPLNLETWIVKIFLYPTIGPNTHHEDTQTLGFCWGSPTDKEWYFHPGLQSACCRSQCQKENLRTEWREKQTHLICIEIEVSFIGTSQHSSYLQKLLGGLVEFAVDNTL